MKKILSGIVIIGMFLLVSAVDTVETTNKNDITNARVQAQINMESKGR